MRTGFWPRFGGFALGHAALCQLCFLGYALLSHIMIPIALDSSFSFGPLFEGWVWVVSPVTILLYFPAGMAVAALFRWGLPRSFVGGVLAVLGPAIVAWTWAAAVLSPFLLEMAGDLLADYGAELPWLLGQIAGDQSGPFLLLAFFASFCFAAPSSNMMLLVMQGCTDLWEIALGAFFAGLLPPLLFALGSLLSSALRREKPLPPPNL